MKRRRTSHTRRLRQSWSPFVAGVLLLGALALFELSQGGGLSGPEFSVRRGIFRDPFEVMLSSPGRRATIRYTLDGSAPSKSNGLAYDKPIVVDGTTLLRAATFKYGLSPSPVKTHTYLFPRDVVNQPVVPDGFPEDWTGDTCPVEAAADYEMDPEIVKPPSPCADMIEPALLSLPTLSIVTETANLFDPVFGIYANPQQEGSAWERKVSVEFFDPNDPEGFQVDCGLRIQGQASRRPDVTPKHSFRLFFRAKYGSPKLRFPLFGEAAASEFDTIALRGGTHDSWPIAEAELPSMLGLMRGPEFELPAPGQADYIRDQYTRDLLTAMGHVSVHGRFVHLYLNGLYWGLYNVLEWPDAEFMSSYFGAHATLYDVTKAWRQVDGDTRALDDMWAMGEGYTMDDAKYDQFQRYVDLDSFIDFLIANHYVANMDWGQRNWLIARRREPAGPFHYFVWDAEFTLMDVGQNNIDNVKKRYLARTPTQLLRKAKKNSEFRMLFADHVQRRLFNSGVLTPKAAADRWTTLANQVDAAMVAESARWGDAGREKPFTRDGHWLGRQAKLLDEFFPARTEILLEQYRRELLYPRLDAPVFSRRGGRVADGFVLEMSAASGTIYFTLDWSDPRVAGGAINEASATAYAEPIRLGENVTVKARVLDGEAWSALNEAKFTIGPAVGAASTN